MKLQSNQDLVFHCDLTRPLLIFKRTNPKCSTIRTQNEITLVPGFGVELQSNQIIVDPQNVQLTNLQNFLWIYSFKYQGRNLKVLGVKNFT